MVVADNADSVMPPVAAPPAAAPLNEPPTWPMTAAAPAAPASPPAAMPADSASAQPADSAPQPLPPASTADVAQPQQDTAPPRHSAARTPSVARNGEFAETSNHVPALLGAVSALVIIIIGSFAGRLLTGGPRQRTPADARQRDWHASVSDTDEDAPGIVPVMPDGGSLAHAESVAEADAEAPASPDDWGLRRNLAPRRPAPPQARRPAPTRKPAPTQPGRESTRVLEDNVRELLHRLQLDLRGQALAPAAAAAGASAHVPSSRELDAVLAIWRAKRGG